MSTSLKPEADRKILYPQGLPSQLPRSRVWAVMMKPASVFYRVGLAAARRAGSRRRISPYPFKVVSVGNLEVGGSGKTPLVMAVLEDLLSRGLRPVYVSRGYRSRAGRMAAPTLVPARAQSLDPIEGVRVLSRNAFGLAGEVGDEAVVVARRFPQVALAIGRDKAACLRAAANVFRPSHVVVDDGFQSWRLWRDVDVVVLDGARPFGNGRLIPSGTLREEPPALRRAHFIGGNGCGRADLDGFRRRLGGLDRGRGVFVMERIIQVEPFPSEVPVASIAALARPERFEADLAGLGLNLVLSFRFPDHHPYKHEDMVWVERICRREAVEMIVTTEKDWVKMEAIAPASLALVVARLDVRLHGDDLLAAIRKPQPEAAV